MSDVIYALATPPGRSGVAVVRLSGAGARAVAVAMAGDIEIPRHAYFRTVRSADGAALDDALVLWFKGPNSFTGEDVVELQIHGGRAVISAVLGRLGEFPTTRAAEAGEFTRRALENGKLDMLQVEALGEFIDADTELQRERSLGTLQGDASRWATGLRDTLVEAMSLVTASIDFVDEELPASLTDQVDAAIEDVLTSVSRETLRAENSKSLRDGFRVAIIGRPNVGKSTLINAIIGREVAIATDIAGTTRDVIEVFKDIGGLPLFFFDTAGLRETIDRVEGIGIERARTAAANADLRIFLYEDISELSDLGVDRHEGDLLVQSKSDIHAGDGLAISAKTGMGIPELIAAITDYFSEKTRELGLLSNERQIEALATALIAVEDAASFARHGEESYELLAESLRQAVFALDRLIGRVDVEDMLDVIFSRFCIGK